MRLKLYPDGLRGVVTAGEECDDGNATTCDGCSPVCRIETGLVCGDGILNTACGEQCDDSDYGSCDGCSITCQTEVGFACGDGIVDAACGEECEDGNTVDTDVCDNVCRLTDAPERPAFLVQDINVQPAPEGGTNGSGPLVLTDLNGTLLFSANDGLRGRALWRSEGTWPTTELIHAPLIHNPFCTPAYNTPCSDALVLGDDVFFGGPGLWKTDGTAAGTIRVVDSGFFFWLTAAGNRLFFVAPSQNRWGLWVSDGTEAGTSPVGGGAPTSCSWGGCWPVNAAVVGDDLFFAADGEDETGRELWVSDGTAAGTRLVKDIMNGTESSSPENLIEVGDVLFFTADDGVRGRELWVSDGSEDGTFLLRDIVSGAGSSSPDNLTNAGGTLFFSAYDTVHDRELWKSNGTAVGTMLVKDIRPALGSSDPKALTDIDGRLVFCACKRDSGCEVWTSDGTEAGTLEVAEIPRGNTSSSNPSQFVRSGSLIYFTADDGVHGRELWAIPLSALGEPVPTTPVKTATGTPTATRTITATPTATPTPMNTMTPVPTVTRTPTLPPTQAPTATRNSGGNSSGCTVTPGRGSNAWWLLVPALLVGTRVRHPCRTRR